MKYIYIVWEAQKYLQIYFFFWFVDLKWIQPYNIFFLLKTVLFNCSVNLLNNLKEKKNLDYDLYPVQHDRKQSVSCVTAIYRHCSLSSYKNIFGPLSQRNSHGNFSFHPAYFEYFSFRKNTSNGNYVNAASEQKTCWIALAHFKMKCLMLLHNPVVRERFTLPNFISSA